MSACRPRTGQSHRRNAGRRGSRARRERNDEEQDKLVILTRCFDLLAWLVPKSETFPRAHRHTVVQRLVDSALDFQELLFRARKATGTTRRQRLQEADARLDQLRLYLRLAHHWHWLNDGQYEHVGRLVAELGRLLGGWVRQESERRSTPG
ncbi:MAG TPA: diversity-generating retroelement protein Avd [Candidatus Accumulibacter sp.]|uniref:diversity-generating retroelement protein Avd n=1 Tax=Accumulibacter sp. TaxID=2053492 RepID=UPI000EDD761C|nr:diversity-generating retroelement protein Avd [Accumulibacter sp.]HCZ14310.1 diversity-generating retroelement protein Avd [Accumulibacter sp.]